MKKLCLLKFSALGDLAQIEPFLPSLAREYEITLFTTPIGRAYYETSPYIKQFIILKSKKIPDLLKTIPQFLGKFDCFVDLQGNDRSKFLSFFSLTKRIGNYTKGFKVVPIPTSIEPFITSQSVYHLDLYSILSQLPIHYTFQPFIPRKKEYIVLNCGSSPKWVSKRLPKHKWKEIADVLYQKFQLPFVLTGEASEESYILDIAQQWEYPTQVLAGKTSLQELKNLLKNASLIVSTDSASLHIASAQGTPSIGIFGATSWIYAKPFGPWSISVYDHTFYPNATPPYKNQLTIDHYYDHIDLTVALQTIKSYLD